MHRVYILFISLCLAIIIPWFFFYRYMKHSNKKYKTRAKKNKETITKEKLEKKETIQTKNILKFILWIPLGIPLGILESILGYDIDFNILRKIVKWGISIIWVIIISYIIIEYVSLKIIIFWWIIVIIILLIIILKRTKNK